MKKKLLAGLLITAVLAVTTGCGKTQAAAVTTDTTDTAVAAETTEVAAEETAGTTEATTETTEEEATTAETITLIGLADTTPHTELVEFVTPILAKQGIVIDLVGNAADGTWNEKVESGEVDFAFFAHWPYVDEYNTTNDGHLVNAGNIHIEPIAAYSNTYATLEEVPDEAKVVIPNDGTNEYRALLILEKAGFIKLKEGISGLAATVDDVEEYIKPIEIVELDSAQIIGVAQDFDIYIVNTNKALEAGIDTTNYLFREGTDSPYANIIEVVEGREKEDVIVKLVEALQSDEVKAFIEEKYNGAVIPAN